MGSVVHLFEQGIMVLKLNDYEWFAGKSADEIVACAAKHWGYPSVEAADHDGILEREDIETCDLDKCLINTAEEGQPPLKLTFRQEIQKRLASGKSFPAFFCGRE